MVPLPGSGAGSLLDLGEFLVADGGVGTLDHGGNEVEVLAFVLSGFHGSSGDEDGGYVQPHGCHEHPGCDLVAVGDADHGIGLVGVDHIFYAVGDDVARWQGIEHPVVPHGDAVVDGDGVELSGIAAEALYFALDNLSGFVEVCVAGHELCKTIDDGDDGSAELFAFHAVGHP